MSPLVPWDDALVVEIGSLNVNGQARDNVPDTWEEWVGIDVLPGDGVDHVGHATEVLPMISRGDKIDIIVTTEALEHDVFWKQTLEAVVKALKPGGHLVITCAGLGRPPHAADGSGPPHPDEHYENVSLGDIDRWIGLQLEFIVSEEGPPGDTRVLARKL